MPRTPGESSRPPSTRCWAGSPLGRCERSAPSIGDRWQMLPRHSCAPLARGLGNIASAAPIWPPLFRKNRNPKSKTSCGAFGIISGALPRNLLTSIACKSSRLLGMRPATSATRSIPLRASRARDRLDIAEGVERLRQDCKPALIFAAHRANWELPALIAAKFALDATVLYRRPNIIAVSEAVIKIRKGSMGTLVPTSLDAPLKLARILEGGGQVAMLVDQYYVNGVDVTFFGRPCKANPFIARLARHVECPIYGTRVVRLPDRDRFRAELSEPLEPRRDTEGRIDVQGTMQAITSVIEGWVRQHPDQWLWLHRRWR